VRRREVLQRADLVVLVDTSKGGTPSRLESIQMFAFDNLDHGDETRDGGGGHLSIRWGPRGWQSVEGQRTLFILLWGLSRRSGVTENDARRGS